MHEHNNGISRRDLFKFGGIAAAGVVGAGALASCAPQGTGSAGSASTTSTTDETTTAAGHLRTGMPSFLTAPEAITDVKETKDYDVVVIGAGASGVPAALSAFEAGAKVALLQKESQAIAQGNSGSGIDLATSNPADIANLVSQLIADSQHRPNRELVELWAQNSGEAVKWVIEKSLEGGAQVIDQGNQQHMPLINKKGYDINFVTSFFGPKPYNTGDGMRALAATAEKEGVEIFYSTPAEQLVTGDGGKVTGVIAKGKDGHVQFNASKGVIVACGDYQNDEEMLHYYQPDMTNFEPKQTNKTGDGHKMGMWVGAQLQDLPLPTMMHPQAFCWFHGPFLFVNDNGERFMCEDTWVQGKSLAINRQPNGEAWSIFDANWKTDLVNGLPYGGGMFWDSFRPYGSDLELAPQYFETQIPEYIKAGNAYQADTLDELAKQIGCDAATFKATVERYNGMCEAGEDTDYYKKPVFLTPVKEGPFYALKVGPALLAVPGGLRTNNDFQCLDAEGAPIEGLYALGNVMGDICAVDYPINVAGNSHGRCITYGYLLGHELAGA